AGRAPRATMPPPRRRAWLRIFVVRCGLPCDPPLGVIHAMGDDTTLPSRGLRLRPAGKSSENLRMTAWVQKRCRDYQRSLKTRQSTVKCGWWIAPDLRSGCFCSDDVGIDG